MRRRNIRANFVKQVGLFSLRVFEDGLDEVSVQ